ncbi:Spo11/DNA topoisomerase VI subunit A [Truncatella angustata]|uniref:DNA topoisomerase (ATP-hydrolyzing) n=1 Tax=Truncatella angustata TaxID=152316 RepID=A0A9P8UHZ9_9PEZI|nr:Spo11/DNA topoisomerase VI subunit A [Truncatella angustata]KAH6652542.1 Spo11/DNA topoisomerase VI subunit A [Truncatella angustata]KAH8200158.1 hypothetical protein TruAng_005670 [Truncatella angustata]
MDQEFFTSSSGMASSSSALVRHQPSSSIPAFCSSYEESAPQRSPRQEPENVSQGPAAPIITRIENTLESVVDALKDNRRLAIPMRSRRTGNEIEVLFPTASSSGARRFAALLQVLYHCHEALVHGTVITKRSVYACALVSVYQQGFNVIDQDHRHIYYQHPDLFGTQSYVNQLVDDVAFTFGVSRDALNIVAASKGLVAGGPFDVPGHHGVSVPHTSTLEGIDIREIQWILIIEKEATFRSLAAARYFETSAAGPGLLVTAKGYPDLATRQFLHFIHHQHHCASVHALVDFDPDGISIMRTYKRGSRSLQHEENVTIPSLVWMGVKVCDIAYHIDCEQSLSQPPLPSIMEKASIPRGREASSQLNPQYDRDMPASGLIHTVVPRLTTTDYKTSALSMNDRYKAVNLLATLNNEEDLGAEELDLICELQLMLMLNVKFEIQAIGEEGRMIKWLDERLAPASNLAILV